jgi:hypothetical protein
MSGNANWSLPGCLDRRLPRLAIEPGEPGEAGEHVAAPSPADINDAVRRLAIAITDTAV